MTKKYFLLSISFIFISFSFRAFSQGYFPFPEDNAIWNLKYEDYWGNSNELRFGIIGEEQIGDKTYKKLFQLADSNLTNSGATYIGGLREENKRIYLILNNTEEQVLYDFNLEVGDSIKYNYGGLFSYPNENFQFIQSNDSFYRKVTSIDTLTLFDGSQRRHFYLSGNGLNLDDEWIEGIGSSNWLGLFNPIVNDISTNGDSFHPICFKHNDAIIFLENSDCDECFCSLFSNIYEHKNEILQVFPNPAKNIVTLNIKTKDFKAKTENRISILDLNSKLIKDYKFTFQKIEIDLTELKQGFYFYKMFQNDKLVQTGKIIKE